VQKEGSRLEYLILRLGSWSCGSPSSIEIQRFRIAKCFSAAFTPCALNSSELVRNREHSGTFSSFVLGQRVGSTIPTRQNRPAAPHDKREKLSLFDCPNTALHRAENGTDRHCHSSDQEHSRYAPGDRHTGSGHRQRHEPESRKHHQAGYTP